MCNVARRDKFTPFYVVLIHLLTLLVLEPPYDCQEEISPHYNKKGVLVTA